MEEITKITHYEIRGGRVYDKAEKRFVTAEECLQALELLVTAKIVRAKLGSFF